LKECSHSSTLISTLSWSEHIAAVCTKASKRLYFLKLLKRSGMTSDDLVYYYKTVIRPVTEYACAVWHSSITAEQRDQLEAIQRRAVRMIFGNEVDFETIAIIQDIPLLADRRDRQTRQMYIAMHDSSHCLYRLLLENSVEPAIHRLHKHKNYQVPFSRTSRFKNSFLSYALWYCQWTSVIYFDLLTFCAVYICSLFVILSSNLAAI